MKMSTKSVVKKKKLQTTLGKAIEIQKEETGDCLDVAHLKKPIETSIYGLREIVSLLQNATNEVKHYITYECDVMYECRICRTIFRSLANFILHKRKYCTKKYSPTDGDVCQDNNDNLVPTTIKNTENSINNNQSPVKDKSSSQSEPKIKEKKKNISAVLEKLLEKQEERKNLEKIASIDLSKETEKDYDKSDERNAVALEKIDSNTAGVFQTMFKDMIEEHKKMDSMKTEVMELHGVFASDEAVLGPDGKIHSFETENATTKRFIPKNNLICTICNQKFSTKKTLTYHVKYKHNSTRMVYQCPECNDQFANAWCVFRHLYKIHRKTSTQIRKMRDDIHANAFRKDQESLVVAKKNVSANATETGSGCNDTENQWMENIEGDIDLQMCGGCGKRFERKAALYSHSQMCLKRIAVCNTIKEKNTKQATDEARSQKLAKNNTNHQPKGSDKRKPRVLRKKCSKSREGKNVIERKDSKEKLDETDCDIFEDSTTNSKSVIAENKPETSSTFTENEKQEPETDCSLDGKQKLDESICSSNDLPEEPPIDAVTVDPSMDFEPEYDILSMGSEHLSLFRSSIIHADVCNVIGVPLLMNPSDSEEIKTESNHENDEEVTCGDVNNDSVAQLFFDGDDSSWNLSEDREITIKSPICNLNSEPEENEKTNRKYDECSSSETTTTLEMKSEEYTDKTKCLCLPCDIEFNSNCDLIEHMSKHFSWYCYQCSKCNYMCYYETTCIQHVRKQHNQSTIENTVLPVPNWKALKLSTDFIPLKDDLKTRKMIMEVIFGSGVDVCSFPDSNKQPRPIRKRTKSVKTYQDDFCYDLNTIKTKKTRNNGVNLSQESMKKSNVAKKKNSKSTQETNCASKLLVIKPLKVYAKRENAKKGNNALVSSTNSSDARGS